MNVPLPPRSIAIVATDTLHVNVAPMVVAMVMVVMVMVAMVMVMVVLMIHWPQDVARPITVATDHLEKEREMRRGRKERSGMKRRREDGKKKQDRRG